jgi:hypothetical protein
MDRGPVFFSQENQGGPNRSAPSLGSPSAEQRRAVLVGFQGSLERAIVDIIEPQGLEVTTAATPELVPEQSTSPPHLMVVSGRCGVLSVLELIEVFGTPRSTRVVVLLHGPDAEIERAYRAAGIRMVLTMPVGLQALLGAGGLEDV